MHKQYVDYGTNKLGQNPAKAESSWKDFKTGIQGDLNSSDRSHMDMFNASRRAAGTPLPPEFRETDPVINASRYFDRSAIDLAHYKFMEKDPSVLTALGVKKDAWGNPVPQSPEGGLAHNPVVQDGLNTWRPEIRNPADNIEHSLSSALTSMFISGPPLEMHKMVSNIVGALSTTTNPLVMVKAVSHALTNVTAGYQTSIENGAVKLTANSIGKMLDGNSTGAERLHALAALVRRVSSLNGMTTIVGHGLVQSISETIIPSKILRAQNGSVTDLKFLRNLDPSFDLTHNYTQAEMSQLASRMGQYVHGTGDIRSLPGWMLRDTEVSGFFSLAHWSIAQTNNFMKNVYEPATRGDIKPLLVGVFGAAVGGYLIKELRQDIQGKKNPIPSLSEIAASDRGLEGNKGLVAYNMIAAMQYSGFGGLLSQVAKYPLDAIYKNDPQGATFPMDEVAGDLASTLHNVSSAIANDPNINWVDLAQAVSMHMLSTNFQLGRIAINQGINAGVITGMPAEKKMLQDKMQQLRRFDMTEGLPYQDIDAGSNPYLNLEQKQFKSTQDVGKAMKELPGLINNIIETYKGSPDVMMAKLKALKENQYETFPSMEQMPLSAFKYLGYLQRLEGPQAAQEELMSYMKHKVVNEAKASAVP